MITDIHQSSIARKSQCISIFCFVEGHYSSEISKFESVKKVSVKMNYKRSCLVLLSSTLVSLTCGKMPLFMLAEPVIMLAAVVAFAVCVVKSRKSK